MMLGIVICALGATIYMIMDIVPNTPEGFNLALAEKFNILFSKAKIISDLLFIAVGTIISLVFICY